MTLLNYPWTFTPGEEEDSNQLVANFAAVQGVLNGGLGENNLVPGLKFPDSKLASPVSGTWRALSEVWTWHGDPSAFGYFVAQDGARALAAGFMVFPGRAVLLRPELFPACPPLVSKLRLVARVINYASVASVGPVSFALSPVTAVTGTDYQLNLALGGPVGTVSLDVPALSPGTLVGEGAEFTLPASGLYTFVIVAPASPGRFYGCRLALLQRFVEA